MIKGSDKLKDKLTQNLLLVPLCYLISDLLGGEYAFAIFVKQQKNNSWVSVSESSRKIITGLGV